MKHGCTSATILCSQPFQLCGLVFLTFQLDKKDFLKNPDLYKPGIENTNFNKSVFYRWIFKGIF